MNRTQTIAFITGVTILLTPCMPARAADQFDYFTDDGFVNAIATMQHPSSEYYNGVTYVAYQGNHEDAYVCAYNHNQKKWYGSYLAGESLLGDKWPEVDNHGKPTLVVSNDGYIHLFYGGHGGLKEFGVNPLGNNGGGKQTHVVSKNPEDITAWEELPNVSPFGTYNQTVKMDNGDIYLFYRHGAHKSHWTYQKSTDNGRTFSDEVIILWHKIRQDDPNIHDAWYAWFDKGIGNTIIATYNYHLCSEVDHDAYRYNCYYMMMNCSDGTWENAAGQTLTVPITKEYADLNTLIYDSGTTNTRREVCGVDANGNPSVTFRLDSAGYELYYSRWNGSAWETPVRPDASAKNSADMIFKSPSEIDMLVYAKDSGIKNISWWHTDNAGLSWTKGQTLISSDTKTYGMSTRTRYAHPDGQFVFFEEDPADPNGLYRKMYLWGESGFATLCMDTTVVFQADFEGSVSGSATATNLNAGTALGSWDVQALQDSLVVTGATTALLADQGFYPITANFSQPLTLKETAPAQLHIDTCLRRSAEADTRPNDILGIDSSGNTLFHIRLYARRIASSNDYYRVGYVDSLGSDNYIGSPGDLNKSSSLNTNAFKTLSITLYTNRYDVLLDGVPLAGGIGIPLLTNSVSGITSIAFEGVESRSGAWYDNILASGWGSVSCAPVKYTLQLIPNNPLWGDVSPMNGEYTAGTNVQISASASNYYQFVNWIGAITNPSPVTSVLMDTNKVITANFAEILATNNIPIWWLASHGLETNDSAALTDTDLDGMENWMEYIAGTLPQLDTSFFAVSDLAVNADESIIQWEPAVEERTYTVYSTTNLSQPFTLLQSDLHYPQNVYTSAMDQALHRFFRIQVELD